MLSSNKMIQPKLKTLEEAMISPRLWQTHVHPKESWNSYQSVQTWTSRKTRMISHPKKRISIDKLPSERVWTRKNMKTCSTSTTSKIGWAWSILPSTKSWVLSNGKACLREVNHWKWCLKAHILRFSLSRSFKNRKKNSSMTIANPTMSISRILETQLVIVKTKVTLCLLFPEMLHQGLQSNLSMMS